MIGLGVPELAILGGLCCGGLVCVLGIIALVVFLKRKKHGGGGS